MNKKERAKFSKFMQKQDKLDRERQARLKQEIDQADEKVEETFEKPSVALAKTREKKDELLNWINEYYSDVLVIHPNAEKAFFDDKRSIDLHRLCMMIHYLSGYTKYRNDGGRALDALAARDYDVEDSGYKVEPAGSGQGALEFHKDKYIISIEENGEKKSFIGYMPGHLPIRNASH